MNNSEIKSSTKFFVNAQCINTDGNYDCKCNSGYSGDGYNCQDVDECVEENSCTQYEICENSPGSYTCLCPEGFSDEQDENQICEDIDECVHDVDECDENATCKNSVGSYSCACNGGFS